jgi:predicted amidohydrolase
MRDIRLTVVQMNSVVGDADGNLRRMERFIRDNGDSDIICFPEMCLSGYTTNGPAPFALRPDDEHIVAVKKLSEDLGVAVVFGYMEIDGVSIHLRQEIVSDGETVGFYRKTHLGAAESKVFEPGCDIPVFNVKEVCVGLHLCVESHIPDISQTLRSKGAELLLIPFANGISGEKRRQVWASYMPARASDNGVFVAGCSSVGDNGAGSVLGGGLIVYDPKGNVVCEYYGMEEKSLTAAIGGKLPRDGPETMSNISYYDRRRPELYRRFRPSRPDC